MAMVPRIGFNFSLFVLLLHNYCVLSSTPVPPPPALTTNNITKVKSTTIYQMRIREILQDMNYLQNSPTLSVFACCIASFISWRVYISSNKIHSLEAPEDMT